ncbi:Yip1 family protein [Candidatus Binatus sp.]|uniref:Yip1 family protein n=1 Tax=Candidatus Binatus sp. TaxID=2811406 RepID=UPI002F957E4C
MANGAGGSITPFFTIWTAPRATIRRIVDADPTHNVIALAAIGSGISALSGQWSKALGNNANLSVLWPLWVAFIVALSAALGVLSLFIGGVVLKWTGSLLGGVASRVEVRAALAWSQVPAIAGAILFLIAVLLGVPIPVPTPGALPQIAPAFFMIIVVEGVLGFWGFIVSLKCIGEVHRFSAWRALAAVLIPGLIALAAIGFIVFAGGRMAGHH